jgi:hypothetical protein
MADNLFTSIASAFSDQAAFIARHELDHQIIWKQLKIKDVSITSGASQTDQPISNVEYNDNGTYNNLSATDIQPIKILNPAAVRVVALCSDISTVDAVMNDFADTTMTISITSKSIIIPDLVISTIDLEHTGNMLSAVEMTIEFEQAQPPTPMNYVPNQAGDASSYGIQIQTLKPSTFSISSLASQVAQKIIPPSISSVTDALLGSHGEPFLMGMGGSKLS